MEESGLLVELNLASAMALDKLLKERELRSKIEELKNKVKGFSQSIELQKVY
ncbi:hypothetical protein AHAS_Ahas14G0152100 [Arachis hypogaea]